MTEAFIAFVRFEEKLLLLSRSKDDNDFPGLWDGVWGVGDTPEEVLARVSEATGLPLDTLEYIGTGPERGIDMGRNLVDVMPILVATSSEEVTPTGRYVGYEWVDPGTLQDKNCLFSNMDMEGADKLFREMYGSVGSFLYIVKTAIGSELRVADEMYARLHGSGSLTALQGEIFSVLHPNNMRGYVFVESSALHHVEKLIGRSGGRDPTARRGISQTPLKNAKQVLPGEALSWTSSHTSSQRPLLPVLKSVASSKLSLVHSRVRKPVLPVFLRPRKRSAWSCTNNRFQ